MAHKPEVIWLLHQVMFQRLGRAMGCDEEKLQSRNVNSQLTQHLFSLNMFGT